MKLCTVEGCCRETQARGLCNTHYWQWYVHGAPNTETQRKRVARLRSEAGASGRTTYETGEPCKRGHVAPRFVSSSRCTECRRAIERAKYQENPAPFLAATKRWGERNPGKQREIERKWNAANRDRKNEHRARRRAAELRATPVWADRDAIREIYAEAHRRGLHVDHVIPLQGETVCGLHVESNLQLLEPRENWSKGNKMAVPS